MRARRGGGARGGADGAGLAVLRRSRAAPALRRPPGGKERGARPGAVQHGGAAGRGRRLRTALSPRSSTRAPGSREGPEPPGLGSLHASGRTPAGGAQAAAGFCTGTCPAESHGQRGELGRGRAPRRAGGGRRRGWRLGERPAPRNPSRHGGGPEPAERGGEETDRCCHVKGAGAAQGKRPRGRCGVAFYAQARTA